MKILHIIPSYKPAYIYAGVIESVARLCEGLAEAGHDVHVYTTTANGKTELDVTPGKPMNVDGVTVTYFRRLTKDPTHVSPALWRKVYRHAHEYDAVHLHTWWNALIIVTAAICQYKKIKTIISPRGMLSRYIFVATRSKVKKWLHYLIGKRILMNSIFHATAQSEFHECTTLLSGWKGFVLPNILRLPQIEIKKSDNPVFTLIFLSRIHPKKGLELLFEAMNDLPFDIKLNIAGTGDEKYIARLKQLAASFGIENKITWLGWMDRVEKYNELMKSDAFVLISHNENFANVVIESLQVGTPVLISEQVGLVDFVRDNGLGWITTLSVPTVRTAIINAYENKSQRMLINQNGRAVVEKNFSQSYLIDQYLTNYVLLHSNHEYDKTAIIPVELDTEELMST